MKNNRRFGLYIIILGMIFSCQTKEEFLFLKRLSDETGIYFKNELSLSDTINSVFFEYIYNGSGVAIGDVNNDGLKDIFFGGNMVTSRLYLNLGGLKFKDVTEISGSRTNRWCTGTSFVDINDDGLLDLYICVAGHGPPETMKNIFFINQGLDDQGIPRFKNMAKEMGLDDMGYSTMGIFLDYDKDADLDLYILTNTMSGSERNVIREIYRNGESVSTDRLYKNNGDGTFTNASREAGILIEGHGLGVNVCDINQDNWPDIYCANDFISNDLLWINNRDGTFTDAAGEYFKHFPYSSMGMDVADYNNDGLLDVFILDMMPVTNLRQKLMIGFKNFNTFYNSLEYGYYPQFMRNQLQLNLGKFADGRYRFSEIGYLAGIYQTDWSWAPLLVDFDNDGWKDLLITNGFRKDVTNLDFIYQSIMNHSPFGTPEAKKRMTVKLINQLPEVKLPNYIFKNKGDLTFTDESEFWGLNEMTFTNGTSYADLDDDGDIDLVLNNLDQDAMIYENILITENKKNEKNHFLKIQFDKTLYEHEYFGSKIWIYHDHNHQFFEYTCYRGYKSTIDPDIHVGLGTSQEIDSIIIQWPDGKIQKQYNIKSDTNLLIVKHSGLSKNSESHISEFALSKSEITFLDITDSLNLKFIHHESSPNDQNIILTLIHSLSRYGPGMSVGDVDQNGLEDIFVGNDAGHLPAFFMQNIDKTFTKRSFTIDSSYEITGSLLFDIENDGDLDLYLVSGGSLKNSSTNIFQDRLFLNGGAGVYTEATELLPPIDMSGSCVIAGDYDKDGDLDLFVGGRINPGNYPLSAQSYLLENRNGMFYDQSELLGRLGGEIGIVNSALWTDVNSDDLLDLMIVGEWMPITILLNDGEVFIESTVDFNLEHTTGWWNCINATDLDNDGDVDYLLGNNGLNSYFKASQERPVEIYARDFDKNGTLDPIITQYIQEESYIVHPRDVLARQIPGIRRRFDTYEKYGNTPFTKSFTDEELKGAIHLKCEMMQSILLENLNGKAFRIHELPLQTQFSPIYGITFFDLNGDDLKDIITIGNSYSEETITGYYDASYGTILLNQGNFQWEILSPNKSNFIADGDKKALIVLPINNQPVFIISENNGPLKAFLLKIADSNRWIELNKDDLYVIFYLNGQTQKTELYHGSGFLSSNSRKILVPSSASKVTIIDFMGKRRTLTF